MTLGERGPNFQNTGDIDMSAYLSDTGINLNVMCVSIVLHKVIYNVKCDNHTNDNNNDRSHNSHTCHNIHNIHNSIDNNHSHNTDNSNNLIYYICRMMLTYLLYALLYY